MLYVRVCKMHNFYKNLRIQSIHFNQFLYKTNMSDFINLYNTVKNLLSSCIYTRTPCIYFHFNLIVKIVDVHFRLKLVLFLYLMYCGAWLCLEVTIHSILSLFVFVLTHILNWYVIVIHITCFKFDVSKSFFSTFILINYNIQ